MTNTENETMTSNAVQLTETSEAWAHVSIARDLEEQAISTARNATRCVRAGRSDVAESEREQARMLSSYAEHHWLLAALALIA